MGQTQQIIPLIPLDRLDIVPFMITERHLDPIESAGLRLRSSVNLTLFQASAGQDRHAAELKRQLFFWYFSKLSIEAKLTGTS
jgi:hypothetical protein